jgi:Mg-chelatase subunit ChlI
MGLAIHHASTDQAETVARIATARRDRLIRVYRGRLRFEDLEDCYSQATLELLARSQRSPFVSADHIRNAHAWWYVDEVLSWARRYRSTYEPLAPTSLP